MTSSIESIYKNKNSSRDDRSTPAAEPAAEINLARHVSPGVAHELNNILTIVQGYAERLMMKYPNDAALQPQLKSISDAARRAALIIRDCTPQIYTTPSSLTPPTEPEPTAA